MGTITGIALLGSVLVAAQLGLIAYGAGRGALPEWAWSSTAAPAEAGPDAILLDDLATLDTIEGIDSGDLFDRFRFVADVDLDEVSDRVTYEVLGGRLLRTVERSLDGRWEPAASEVVLGSVVAFKVSLEGEGDRIGAGGAQSVRVRFVRSGSHGNSEETTILAGRGAVVSSRV